MPGSLQCDTGMTKLCWPLILHEPNTLGLADSAQHQLFFLLNLLLGFM
jgi:hypothetical protein